MIFYYAAGGGLGHLTRARAFLHTLGIEGPVTIITASDFASDRRVTGGHDIIQIPAKFETEITAYKNWLRNLFNKYRPSAIYLDAFPAGIVGEFRDFDFPEEVNVYHVARLLRWGVYCQFIGRVPRFKMTYLLEDVEEAHRDFLAAHSDAIGPLELEDPPHNPDEAEQGIIENLRNSPSPLWLIVHAGPDDEMRDLVGYAEEMCRIEKLKPRLVLLAPRKPDSLSIEHFDFYPAATLFPFADRIITAGGFHAMRQTEKYRNKHRFLPFARKFDNQFRRAARRGSGQTR